MRAMMVMILTATLLGCGSGKEEIQVIKGDPGPAGVPGQVISIGNQNYVIEQLIQPCNQTVIADYHGYETGYIMHDGSLWMVRSDNCSNGKNTRWTIIHPGNWETCDGTGCRFTLTRSGSQMTLIGNRTNSASVIHTWTATY